MRPLTHWTRSSFCSFANCVEIATDGDAIFVRDSKDPAAVLRFTTAGWEAFLAGVRAGEFDHEGETR